MIRLGLLAIALLALGLSVLMGGTAPLGRLALALGQPQIAKPLFTTPDWQGIAAYRAGDPLAAEVAFRATSGRQSYNLGNAFVQVGKYAAALEAYDAALAQNPDDAAAAANFDLVKAYYAGTKIDLDAVVGWSHGPRAEAPPVAAETARGSARATGEGDEVTNTGSQIGLPALASRGTRGVRKVFDDKFIEASPRWLATLSDVPGAYLQARISAERKRRKAAGELQPEADSRW